MILIITCSINTDPSAHTDTEGMVTDMDMVMEVTVMEVMARWDRNQRNPLMSTSRVSKRGGVIRSREYFSGRKYCMEWLWTGCTKSGDWISCVP